MVSDHHDSWCKWPAGPPCLSFSTDGTRLGSEIAHTMGTTDEEDIKADGVVPFASDVDAEQADWDADEHEYVAPERGVQSCGLVHPPTPYCGPGPHQDEPMRPYPASKCDWTE